MQVAFQQADYAAWNMWAAIHNRPLLPFKYQHLGDMMTLGKLLVTACALSSSQPHRISLGLWMDKHVAFASATSCMFIMLCRKDRWCSDATNLSAT